MVVSGQDLEGLAQGLSRFYTLPVAVLGRNREYRGFSGTASDSSVSLLVWASAPCRAESRPVYRIPDTEMR